MTEADVGGKLRYDLAGFKGCKGDQHFWHEGAMCNGKMGFQYEASAKSPARNDMENALRLDDPLRLEGSSPAALRKLFAELCVERGAEATAPLLGDVVLFVEMGADMRVDGLTEPEVRVELRSALNDALEDAGATDIDAALQYFNWIMEWNAA